MRLEKQKEKGVGRYFGRFLGRVGELETHYPETSQPYQE